MSLFIIQSSNSELTFNGTLITHICSVPYEEIVPKLMDVDKSTKGTIQEQMFYNRRTLQDITQMRHDNPTDQVQYTIHIYDYSVENSWF